MDKVFGTGRERIGDIAPKLAALTDDVLFADVWQRPGLSPRDRSLVTVAALVSLYRTNEMAAHMRRAMDNGVTFEELVEVVTHLAFYASWPNAQTALEVLKPLQSRSASLPEAARR